MKLSLKIFLISAVPFILVLFFGFILHSTILHSAISKVKSLHSGSFMRNIYVKLPFSLPFCVYFFNVTNPDLVAQGDIPILKEVGPYCYDSWKTKIDEFDDIGKDTMSFSPYDTYIYNENLTKPLSQNDEITILHPFYIGIINSVEALAPQLLGTLGPALSKILMEPKSIYLTIPVKNLLFDGVIFNCTSSNIIVKTICNNLQTRIPDLVEIDKDIYSLSLFGRMNSTTLPRVEVSRGLADPDLLGKVVSYKNRTDFHVWSTDECNQFNGTDGWLYKSFLKPADTLGVVSLDLCRNFYLRYVNGSSVGGLDTLQFAAQFEDVDTNPEEACYCGADECMKKGVMDATNCMGFPLMASMPHFLGADDGYLNGVKGMKPDYDKHVVQLFIEPLTGFPLKGYKRIQFNLKVKKLIDIPLLENVTDTLHPLLWIEEGLTLPDEHLEMFVQMHRMLAVVAVMKWLILIVSFAGLCVAGYLHYKANNIVNITNLTLKRKDMGAFDNAVVDRNDPDKFS